MKGSPVRIWASALLLVRHQALSSLPTKCGGNTLGTTPMEFTRCSRVFSITSSAERRCDVAYLRHASVKGGSLGSSTRTRKNFPRTFDGRFTPGRRRLIFADDVGGFRLCRHGDRWRAETRNQAQRDRSSRSKSAEIRWRTRECFELDVNRGSILQSERCEFNCLERFAECSSNDFQRKSFV